MSGADMLHPFWSRVVLAPGGLASVTIDAFPGGTIAFSVNGPDGALIEPATLGPELARRMAACCDELAEALREAAAQS